MVWSQTIGFCIFGLFVIGEINAEESPEIRKYSSGDDLQDTRNHQTAVDGRIYNMTDVTTVYNVTDVTTAYNLTVVTTVYNVTDVTTVYNMTDVDVTRIYNMTDVNVSWINNTTAGGHVTRRYDMTHVNVTGIENMTDDVHVTRRFNRTVDFQLPQIYVTEVPKLKNNTYPTNDPYSTNSLQDDKNYTRIKDDPPELMFTTVAEQNSLSTENIFHHPFLVPHCHLLPSSDLQIHNKIAVLLDEEQAKLIEYILTISNYSENPLSISNENGTLNYKNHMWSRVAGGHGQTIQRLAFHYGILSLMTLTFGIEKLEIELQDSPSGCLKYLTEEERVKAVMDIVLRDLNPDGQLLTGDSQTSVCHQIIEQIDGFAVFTHQCCHFNEESAQVECKIESDTPNIWLQILDILLGCFFVGVFVFGPLFVPIWIYSTAFDTVNYIVFLKEPLYKSIVIISSESDDNSVYAKHKIDLRLKSDFSVCQKVITKLPTNVVIPIKISQYNIKVNYRKLLTENNVPVSMAECLSKALFLCKLRETEAFKDCCEASYTGCYTTRKHHPWINICEIIGRILVVLLLPFLYYVRILLYYVFEDPEITDRNRAANDHGLSVYYNHRLMHYLTPIHPLYLVAYIMFFTFGLVVAYRGDQRSRFQEAVMDSFAELKQMSWLSALRMFVRNLLYPFRAFGVFGIFFSLILWPVLLPISFCVCFLYCLPIVFLTCRIIFHIWKKPKKKMIFNETMSAFEVEKMVTSIKHFGQLHTHLCRYFKFLKYFKFRRILNNTLATLVVLLVVYSAMIMMAEVLGFFSEIICFTLMGMIVNASKVLKYGSLIFLFIIYSIDTYSNVAKKYEKLNKFLFSEIKSRIKDLEVFTSLPSYMQGNRGFKACENSEQEDYEMPDDIAIHYPDCWDINDLILFVDSEDTPRIPRKIFDDSCEIKIHGAPGPVYRSLIKASGRFVMILFFLCFVFIVVMSFGEVYRVSSTNQMLATLAGGFVPFLLSNMLKPMSADIETNLVSFKSKLGEIIQNFCQPWPMCDFIFNVEENPKFAKNKPEFINQEIQTNDAEGINSRINFCRDLSNPLLDMSDVEALINNMKFEPCNEQNVDILFLINEKIEPWDMDSSTISEYNLEHAIQMINL